MRCLRFAELSTVLLHMQLSVTGALLQTPAFGVGTGQAADLPQVPYNEKARRSGLDWPQFALTMAGWWSSGCIAAASLTELQMAPLRMPMHHRRSQDGQHPRVMDARD